MEKIGNVYYSKGTRPKIITLGQVTKSPGVGKVTINGQKYLIGSQYVPQPGKMEQVPETVEWAPKYTFNEASQEIFRKEQALAEIKQHEPKMNLPVLGTPKGPTAQVKPQPMTFFESMAKTAQESEAVKWSPKQPVSIAPAVFGKIGQWTSLQVAGTGMAAEKEIRELTVNPARYAAKMADPLLLQKVIYGVGKQQVKFAREQPVEFIGQAALGLLAGKAAVKAYVPRAKLVAPEEFWKKPKVPIKMTADIKKAEWVDFGVRKIAAKSVIAAPTGGGRKLSGLEIQRLKEQGIITVARERPRQLDVGVIIRPKVKITETYTPKQIENIDAAWKQNLKTSITKRSDAKLTTPDVKPVEISGGRTKLLTMQRQAARTEYQSKMIFIEAARTSRLGKSVFGGATTANELRRTAFSKPKRPTFRGIDMEVIAYPKSFQSSSLGQKLGLDRSMRFRQETRTAQTVGFKQLSGQSIKSSQALGLRMGQSSAMKIKIRAGASLLQSQAVKTTSMLKGRATPISIGRMASPSFRMEFDKPTPKTTKADVFSGSRTRYNPSLAGVVSGKRLKKEPAGTLTGIGVRYPSISIKKLL